MSNIPITPRMIPRLEHAGMVHSLAWSPNGKYIATAGYGNVKLWEAKGRELLLTINELCYGLCFSP